MDPNLKEWQVPPPSRMWTVSSILQHQLYELVQSSSSLRQHFAVQACVPASCDDSSSSWKWKSWNKFDTEGFDDLFYAEEATYCSQKSLGFFRKLPPHTSSPHLVSSFVIFKCHFSNHLCAAFTTRMWRFVRLPGLVDVEKRFVCEAFATLIAEECGQWSSLFQCILSTGMMKTNSIQKSYSLSPNMHL